MTLRKKLEKLSGLKRKLDKLDSNIRILKSEIEDNLLNNNLMTLINFAVIKNETVEVPKKIDLSHIIDQMEFTTDVTMPEKTEVTNVRYSEDFEVSESFAVKVQSLLLKEMEKERRAILKEIKEL